MIKIHFIPYLRVATLMVTFMLCFSLIGYTQLCTGSLGDPIINETFGNTRTQLPFKQTNLEFIRSCPGKGQYTLTNLIFGCGEDRTWLMMAGDHTRDLNGNYMLVNAQSSDGVPVTAIVYADTAKGLCSDVSYVYSVWVTNAMQTISCGGNAVPARLTLKVTTLSGIVIDVFDTGSLPIENDRKWKEYGIRFKVPQGESAVVLTVSSNRVAGCGQGFAIDDITLRPCGPELKATINGSTAPLNVCADFSNSFVLAGTYGTGFTNPSVQWQSSSDTGRNWTDIPAANALNLTVPRQSNGVILFRMAVAEMANIGSPQCRFSSNEIYTSVHPLPPRRIPQNVIGCIGKDLYLPAKDPFAHRNLWTGPNGFSSTNEKAVVPAVSAADTGLYLMQQDFGFGCMALDSFYVQVYPSTTISVPPEYSICEGQGVVLAASGEGTFTWQPSTGLSNPQVRNPIASPVDSTLYNVVVANAFGCKDSAFVKVNVFRKPQVFVGPDRTIVTGDTVTLNGVVKGTALEYNWSPALFINDPISLTPTVFPTSDMQYKLTATSAVGCGKAEAFVTVKVYNEIYVPNAFSPNNDGRNDYFKIVAADGYAINRFEIYNRWGGVVYRAKDLSKGWDGKFKNLPQPADTYIYFLQLQSAQGKLISKKGSITLIR